MSSLACVVLVLLAAVAASCYNNLAHIVGSAVIFGTILVSGLCCLSSPRIWLFSLLQSVAKLAVEPTKENVTAAEATEASARNETLRAQLGVLEQKLRGTEARARDSEIARETEKKRHAKEVRHLDSQLATVTRGIKESLRAKDQAVGECRHWRRKFEDLDDLQRQAQEDPVRGIKGRARWAPAKKNGVRKGERGRPATKFTAIAQVAIVNAAWESKLVSLESEARDYVARTTDQLGSLQAAATALSEENAYLTQQIQAKANIPHELAQQRLDDAVQRTVAFAEKLHEERVNSLEQTYRKELMAAKVDYERELAKVTAVFKAEVDAAAAQQREAAERATQEINALKAELAAKEAQMGKLRQDNAEIAGDLQVTKEALAKTEHELEEETDRVVKSVQKGDGYLRAGKKLSKKYAQLKSEHDALVGANQALEDENAALNEALEEEEFENRVLEQAGDQLMKETDRLIHAATDRVSNLEHQVANYQTADITQGLQGFGVSAD